MVNNHKMISFYKYLSLLPFLIDRVFINLSFLVTVSVKSRVVKVQGPRGALTKSFKHLNLDIYLVGPSKSGKVNQSLKVDLWLGSKVEAAAIRTVCSHVKNMITGVTRVCGFFFFFLQDLFINQFLSF